MKLFKVLVGVLFSFSAKAQDTITINDLPIKITSSYWGTGYSDNSLDVSVFSTQDGKLEMRGDSIQIINLLWKRLQQCQEREIRLWDFVGAAVNFTNGVPDYWKETKNNKAWRKYDAALKKFGFYKTFKNKK